MRGTDTFIPASIIGPGWRRQLPSADLHLYASLPAKRGHGRERYRERRCHREYRDAIPIIETWILHREINISIYSDIILKSHKAQMNIARRNVNFQVKFQIQIIKRKFNTFSPVVFVAKSICIEFCIMIIERFVKERNIVKVTVYRNLKSRPSSN